ncbi:MAG TPA: glycoside hydrolase [Cyclobacteriaceae bacterium]|nr:glycoside hydrolase [Cyclobacteriaceae bacterium]
MFHNKYQLMRIYYFLILALVFFKCSNSDSPQDSTNTKNNILTIHLNDKKQTIHNFGASDAWTCKYIGQWPDEKRNQVADWLFSKELDANGQPKGIGLSLWRFNIGAGSAAQDNIGDEWRREEGFLKDDLSYDWSKQAGQQWFLKAAKERGTEKFLAFTNSPPVQLTKNGKAFSDDGNQANIDATNYLPFANYLFTVAKHFKDEGTPFDYISPFNEPQWDWTGNGQEGSPYTNNEIVSITKILDSVLSKNNETTKIQIAEAGKLNYLYEEADKQTRGDQITKLFNSQSPLYVGGLSNVDKIISGHSYFTTAPAETLKDVRQNLFSKLSAASVPLEFWQSEYCILGNDDEIEANGKDTGMTPALYVAKVIHHDLTVANASAWHWWLAVTVYDYKDGLIYADKNKTDGKIEDTKLLWALGNFSRFIRPGSVRINVTSNDINLSNVNGIMASSYVDEAQHKVVTVIINYSNSDTIFKLQMDGGSVSSWQPYITGPGSDQKLKPLSLINETDSITIPKKSVVTLVGNLE